MIATGFVLLIGPGVVPLAAGLGWAGYLAYRRTPGVTYGFATLGVVAALLLAAWVIF